MDILKNIEKDIIEVDKSIQRLTESSSTIDIRDHKSLVAIENSIGKARSTKDALRRTYHSVNQDINLKNEEIKAKVLKLKAEVEFLEKQGQTEIQLETFYKYIKDMVSDEDSGFDGSLGGLGGTPNIINNKKVGDK